MAVIRSSNRSRSAPVVVTDPDVDPVPHDEEDEWAWWAPIPQEVEDYEDTLPGADSWWWHEDDEYDEQWFRLGARAAEVDDSPAWEMSVLQPCLSCGARADIDPVGTCELCRSADGRCSWCGLDPVVYESRRACRSCYQQLRRSRVTTRLELRLSMLEAAARRLDLRKRRRGDS